MLLPAKNVLNELPLLVPAGTILFECQVCLVLDRVALVEFPLSSVFYSASGMRDKIVEVICATEVVVTRLEGVFLLYRSLTRDVRCKHPVFIVLYFLTTSVWEQLVPPFVDQGHFEIISWSR